MTGKAANRCKNYEQILLLRNVVIERIKNLFKLELKSLWLAARILGFAIGNFTIANLNITALH